MFHYFLMNLMFLTNRLNLMFHYFLNYLMFLMNRYFH
jgi:hypothetical protein